MEQPEDDDDQLFIEQETSTETVSTNVAGNDLGRFRNDPLGFIIRLTSESSAFFQGEGWRAYQNYIGARIFYPEYTTDIKQAVVGTEQLHYNQEISKKQSVTMETCEKRVWKQVKQILVSMMAELSSMRTLRFVAYNVNNILVRMYHQGIHIMQSEFLYVKKAAEWAEANKVSLVFIPNHKSHVDYLVISYIFYRMGIALPHVAAGDNINLPLVGRLLKNTGAFFIRRQWGQDSLYIAVMKAYIQVLLQKGFNLEFFIEGTRSRIGKLLQPKFGILKIILECMINGNIKDCYIVPMSIGYDKVIETSAYVNELLGSPKQKESLLQLFNNINLLGLKWGRIDVRFARPFLLSNFIAMQKQRRDETFDPLNQKDFKFLLHSLSYRILSKINAVSVIMPTALVGTILLTLRGNGVGEEEMIRKVNWLKKKIIKKGGKVADFGGMSTRTIIERAAQVLRKDLIGQRTDLLENVYYPVNRFELSFYRNQIIHLFISESIISIAIYSTVKIGGPLSAQRIPLSKLQEDVTFLSQLFKSEFVFGSGGIIRNLTTTLHDLVEEHVVTLGEQTAGTNELPSASWVELSSKERKLGRETFDFYCFLLWPFIETYWLSAVSLFTILPQRGSTTLRWVDEKDFMNRAQFFGKTLYYEGDVSYLEALNKETLKNGIARLKEFQIILVHVGHEPPIIPIAAQEAALSAIESTGNVSSTTWLALNADWLPPEALPEPGFTSVGKSKIKPSTKKQLEQPIKYSLHASGPLGISKLQNQKKESSPLDSKIMDVDEEAHQGDLSYAQWTTIEPRGRLWELCETIGKFRREGKNRRDTATVAQRVLRLAALAGSVSDSKSKKERAKL